MSPLYIDSKVKTCLENEVIIFSNDHAGECHTNKLLNEVELRKLCLSKSYLIYMICISSCLVSLLVRNVITHSPCVVCVWILWWSWILCLREQMIGWIALRNLVLKGIGTQCSDRMWLWDISFYINCMKSWTALF